MLHCIVGFVSHIASTTLVWFLALLRLSSTLPYPVHVPVPILCSSKGLHPCSHSRPRSRPRCHLVVLHRLHPVLVPAPSPLPLTSPFARSRPLDPPSVCRDDVCVCVFFESDDRASTLLSIISLSGCLNQSGLLERKISEEHLQNQNTKPKTKKQGKNDKKKGKERHEV